MVTVTCTCAANYLFRRILSYCRGHNVGGAGDGAIDGDGDVGTIRYSTRSMSDDHEWTPVIPGAGTGNWHFHEPSIGTMNARVESAMPSPNCISERERKESGRRREEGRPQRTLKLNVCHCCKPDHRFFLFCTLVETKQLPAGKAAVAAEGPRGYSKRLRNPLTVHRVPCESKK